MRSLAVAIVLATLLALPATARAQEPPRPRQDLELWTAVYAQGDVVDDVFGAYLEVQQRTTLIASERFDRFLLRPAVYLRLEKVFTLWAGYAFTPTLTPEYRDEHRIWEQAMLHNRFGEEDTPQVHLVNRVRFEQRFIEGRGPSLRLRYMLRLQAPLAYEDTISGAIWDEVFFTLNSVEGAPKSGFDQNRFFVGPHFNFTKTIGLDLGYLLVYENRERDVFRHAIVIYLYLSF